MGRHFSIGRIPCIDSSYALTDGRIIEHFIDAVEISSLLAQPLYEDGALKARFKARGERFVALRGRHHLHYNGFMIEQNNFGNNTPMASQNPVGVTNGLGNFRVTPPNWL